MEQQAQDVHQHLMSSKHLSFPLKKNVNIFVLMYKFPMADGKK